MRLRARGPCLSLLLLVYTHQHWWRRQSLRPWCPALLITQDVAPLLPSPSAPMSDTALCCDTVPSASPLPTSYFSYALGAFMGENGSVPPFLSNCNCLILNGQHFIGCR